MSTEIFHLRRTAGEAGKDTRKGESTRAASPWQLAADGLNALVDAGVPPAMVEFSVDGSVTLTDWHLVELAHDCFGTSHMQIGGWLPEDYEVGSVSLGTNHMVRVDLPGRAVAAHDVNVTVSVKGYGGSRRFMKIQWPHACDPSRDARQNSAAGNGGVR
ncbi:hypothetical protein [Streptomyces sp. NPDC051173]|uniref:hypothetical protein n=1 Tax=Streptomyces sp. NPDC051173 TaxID=3155164 RepID=UPI00344C54E4